MIVTTNKTIGAFKRTTNKEVESFLKKRNDLKKKVADYEKGIDKQYQPICKDFLNKVIPYKKGKVYELIENGNKRRSYKRFVIYSFQLQCFARSESKDKSDFVMIRACGWWLDEKTNLPNKWDTQTVFGASNAAVLKLSNNQHNGKVPDRFK